MSNNDERFAVKVKTSIASSSSLRKSMGRSALRKSHARRLPLVCLRRFSWTYPFKIAYSRIEDRGESTSGSHGVLAIAFKNKFNNLININIFQGMTDGFLHN